MYVVIVLQHSLIWSNFQAFRSSKNWTMEGLEHTHTAHGWIKLINLATPHLACIYCIAGNFQGRKLSRIGKNYNFRRENFHRLLACAAPKDAHPQISQRKLSQTATNREIREGFLPQKFPAIRYVTKQAREWGLLTLGESRKYWAVLGREAVRTMRSNTRRSFTGSIPYEIGVQNFPSVQPTTKIK